MGTVQTTKKQVRATNPSGQHETLMIILGMLKNLTEAVLRLEGAVYARPYLQQCPTLPPLPIPPVVGTSAAPTLVRPHVNVETVIVPTALADKIHVVEKQVAASLDEVTTEVVTNPITKRPSRARAVKTPVKPTEPLDPFAL